MNKILIVDDSKTDRMLVRKILETHRYQIVEAEQSEIVADQVKNEKPDLILLDIVMPGKNGYEICRCLKQSEKFRSIPVVLVSAKKQYSDIYWGKLQGADEYLTKPFEPATLLKIVDKFLGKKQGSHING